MTRLQKKRLIAAAGAHLLVVVTLLCSGFITSKPKVDDSQVLTVIPANVMDNVLNSGAKSAPTPPPTPVVPPVEPTPTPTPPTPVIEPVKPVEPVQPPEKIQPEELKPVERPEIEIPKPKKHEIKVDLTKVTRDTKQVKDDTAATEAAAAAKAERQEKRLRDQRLKAIRDAARSIQENSSSATTVEMPGSSSVSYANYASVLKSIYEREWRTPDNASDDTANTQVSVTISRDGSVISSRIITPSGDSAVDGSVQQTLDRVTFIAPFPEGSTENQKTFVITFNLKLKRMLG